MSNQLKIVKYEKKRFGYNVSLIMDIIIDMSVLLLLLILIINNITTIHQATIPFMLWIFSTIVLMKRRIKIILIFFQKIKTKIKFSIGVKKRWKVRTTYSKWI